MMINRKIYLNTLKRSYNLLFIFTVVLCFYLSIIIYMSNGEEMNSMRDIFENMSTFADAFNINILGMTSPLNFVASTFFGMIVMAFLMVFYTIQTINLLIKPIKNNDIIYMLTTPVKRKTIALTQGIYLITSISFLFIVIFFVGIIGLKKYGSFDMNAYLHLTSVTALLNISIAMISYFLSIIFCNKKYGIGITIGFPIFLMVLGMSAGILKNKFPWITDISPFSWIDGLGIVNGTIETTWMFIAFPTTIITFLIMSVFAFNKKNLYI